MSLDTISIDGSQGEGGGQILRSALTLSILNQKPLHIFNIRARRKAPGLKPQHLKSLDAAAAISGAEVKGAALGSQEITFYPQKIRSGRYRFDIGTAGATSLVLQTIFLPLSMAASASSLIIRGGTHVPWSPCFHYLESHWMPFLEKLGFDSKLSLEQAGFYPTGGGIISAVIRPVDRIKACRLQERGALQGIRGLSAVANLSPKIAERQKRQALLRLNAYQWDGSTPEIRIRAHSVKSPTKGTYLLLRAEYEHGSGCFFGLGALGKPAERVADEAVDEFINYHTNDAIVDKYLADQILLPLAFADGESSIRTVEITEHLVTNAAIVNAFGNAIVDIDGAVGAPGTVRVEPRRFK